jgi:hypothetical protein
VPRPSVPEVNAPILGSSHKKLVLFEVLEAVDGALARSLGILALIVLEDVKASFQASTDCDRVIDDRTADESLSSELLENALLPLE